MARALLRIEALSDELESLRARLHEPIAIVGVGCRLPKADSPDAYWELLREGIDAVGEVPSDRWDADRFTDADPDRPGRILSRAGAFLDDVRGFDAGFFGISAREALGMDPQQRLLLEVAYEALEHAGWPSASLSGTRTGVFVGIGTEDYAQLHYRAGVPEAIDAYDFTGTDTSVAAGRIAHTWNLRGPCLAVDTACSSSLVAVHLAVQSIARGECDRALVGGVNLILTPEASIYLSRARALSPTGRCRTFDAAADGYVRGEGAAVVALRPLEHARRDGDRVLAVIRGSAVLHDGRASGLTVPSPDAQAAVIREALAAADVQPAAVSLIEAHGTATALGDPIEVGAIAEVFSGRDRDLWIASHKTNLGHLEAAAGIAGLIKVALSLHNRVLVPHLHLDRVNPEIDLGSIPARIPVQPVRWDDDVGPRVAGVSAFGISGTNAHVVLAAAPPGSSNTEPVDEPLVLPVSAHDEAALAARISAVADALVEAPDRVADIVFTCARRRDHHRQRIAVVARPGELAGLLREHPRPRVPSTTPRLAFVFAGQGSQRVGMARTLYADEAVFRAAFDELDAAFASTLGWSIVEELHADEAKSRLDRVDVVQPLLTATQIALARILIAWGLRPDVVLGHSMGEVAAAVVSGALSAVDGGCVIGSRSRIVAERARPGAMAVAELTRVEAAEHESAEVHLAAMTGPRSALLAGRRSALLDVSGRLEARGRFFAMVDVDYASHSPAMDPLLPALREALAAVNPVDAEIPLLSTVRGALLGGHELDARYWADNLRQPVALDEAIDQLLRRGPVTLVEVGPHPVLRHGLAQWCEAADAAHACLPSLVHDRDDRRCLLELVARLYERGHDPRWSAIGGAGRGFDLPPYPWQREVFWPRVRRRVDAGDATVVADVGTAGIAVTTRALDAEGWVHQHRVGEHALVPAAAFVVWALETVPGATTVSELQIEEGLAVPDGCTMTIQAVARPRGSTGFAVEILARGADDAPWIRHARCRVELDSSPQTPLAVDEAPGRTIAGDELYRDLAVRGYDYGEAFRGIGQVEVGTDVAVAQLERSTAARDARLHPAWLDAAAHAAGPLLPTGRWLPQGLRTVAVFAAAPPRATVRATSRRVADDLIEVDFDVVDQRAVVAQVRGLSLRRVRAPHGAPAGVTLLADDWIESPRHSMAHRTDGRWLVVGSAPALVDALSRYGDVDAYDDIGGVDDAALDGAHLVVVGGPSLAEHYGPLLRAARAEPGPARLTVVTRGAWTVSDDHGDDGGIDPLAAAQWGLVRTLRHEHPRWETVTIDVPEDGGSPDALAAEICTPTDEREVVLRGGRRWVPRLRVRTMPSAPPRRTLPIADQPFRLTALRPGDPSSLRLTPLVRREPGPGEVELEVDAAGLSFSDVLKVHGTYAGAEARLGLGVECSGRVARVGPGVEALEPGMHVLAVVSEGGLASHAIARASLVVPRPSNVDAVAGATIPGAFVTAFHALVTLGRVSAGERVLVHSATGGVGQAAIQIARDAGAVVYATAGTESKRALLAELGVTASWNSRDMSWCEGVAAATGGQGVDIVLNSLSGEALVRGLEVLRPGGRFIELGRRDIFDDRSIGMSVFRRNVALLAVDISDPALMASDQLREAFVEVARRIEQGRYRPLPYEAFPIGEVGDAVQRMARARHTGKLVARVAGRGAMLTLPAPELRARGAWIVTGGTGALGLRVAELLVDAGADDIVLAGRTRPSVSTQADIDALGRGASKVRFTACDVSDFQQVRALVETLPALAGVVHCAVALEDGLCRDVDADRFETPLAAKGRGADNLDRATRDVPLEHFVVFSSLASVLGSPAQGSYAMANAWAEAIVRERHRRGQAALSIAWGPWSDIGLGAADARRGDRLSRRGLPSMSPDAAIETLARLMADPPAPSVAATGLDWQEYRELQPAVATAPRFEALGGAPAARASGTLEDLLADPQPARRRRAVEDWVTGAAARVLGVPPSRVPRDAALRDLGIDSLMTLELRNLLAGLLGRPLSSTLLFSHPSVARLAAFVVEQVEGREADDPSSDVASDPPSESARSEALTDEGVVATLLAELGESQHP